MIISLHIQVKKNSSIESCSGESINNVGDQVKFAFKTPKCNLINVSLFGPDGIENGYFSHGVIYSAQLCRGA